MANSWYQKKIAKTPKTVQNEKEQITPNTTRITHYNTRFTNNYILPPNTITAKYQDVFIQTNKQKQHRIKECKEVGILLNTKDDIFSTKTQYLSRDKGRYLINHTFIRYGLSHLKQQVSSFDITDSSRCAHCEQRV